MSDIIIYGDPRSSFCRSARMACVEKGVSHHLESAARPSFIETVYQEASDAAAQ